jgi:hypothetical protein
MSTKFHIRENIILQVCTKGYAKIHIQRPFFDIVKDIWKIFRLKIQMVCSCFGVPSTRKRFFFVKHTKISIFGGISKFLELIVFGQILAVLGRFGQILLHWQWLTACWKFT